MAEDEALFQKGMPIRREDDAGVSTALWWRHDVATSSGEEFYGRK